MSVNPLSGVDGEFRRTPAEGAEPQVAPGWRSLNSDGKTGKGQRIMKCLIFAILRAAAIALFLLPVCFFVTAYLYPVWTWIENEFGVKAIEHSGPSDWFFWLVYILLSEIAFAAYWLFWRSGRRTDA